MVDLNALWQKWCRLTKTQREFINAVVAAGIATLGEIDALIDKWIGEIPE